MKLKNQERTKGSSKINKQISQAGTQINQEKSKRLIMLRYRDSLKSHSNKEYYVQTDEEFISQIRTISKANQNALISLMDKIKKKKLTDQQCDQIDFYARLHYKANIVNKNTDNQFTEVQERQRCNCGCQRAKGAKLSLLASIKQMSVLGSGVVLFFMFKKGFSLILFSALLIYAIFAIVTNLLGSNSSTVSDCQDIYCQYRTKASSQNKLEPQLYTIIQWWMGVAFCFVWILLLRIIKYLGKRQNQNIDQYLNSSSDYGIIIQNLPYEEYQQNDLIAYFDLLYEKALKIHEMQSRQENNQNTYKNVTYQLVKCPFGIKQANKFNMKSIQLVYNMEFSRALVRQIIQMAIKIKDLFKQREQFRQVFIQSDNLQKYKQLKQQICQTFQFLKDLRKKFFYDNNFRRNISTSVALVQFYHPNDKNLFLKYFGNQKIGILKEIQQKIKSFFKKPSRSVMFRGKVLKIMRAPQPSDILFTNCQKKFSARRVVLIYLITFGIILLSFGLISLLDYLQQRVAQSNQLGRSIDPNNKMKDDTSVTIINIVISLGLQVVNRFLWFALYYILDIEYNHTLTQKIVSQMNKVLFATCVNIIALPIISNYVIRDNIYGSKGLAGMVFDYQISVLGIGLIIKLLDPSNFVKRVFLSIRKIRNFIIRFLCQNLVDVVSSKGVPQINNFYEGAYFDIAQSYVYIMAATYQAAFFCQLQPSLFILVTLVVICFYWVNKFKILRICKIPQITQILVLQTALSQAALVPIIYGAGTLVISYIQNRQNSALPLNYLPAIISISIGLFGFFNPKDCLNKIVKFIMKKCVYNQEKQIKQRSLQRSSSQNGSAQGIINIFKNDQIKDTIFNNQPQMMNRLDNYFRNSNSLPLIGFQNILSGGQFNKFPLATSKQLQKYCRNFLQNQDGIRKLNKKINQTIIHNIVQAKQTENNLLKRIVTTQTSKDQIHERVHKRIQKIKLPKLQTH